MYPTESDGATGSPGNNGHGFNHLANSPTCKWIFVVLALLYLSSGAYVLAAVIASLDRQLVNPRVRSELFQNGILYGIVGSVCLFAFIVLCRRLKISNLVSGVAACITSFVAVKALATAITTGFLFYHLIEPLIALPSVVFILSKLFRRA